MSANVDFRDERVNRIADVTFEVGAVAEWCDMLASIDADLALLATARASLREIAEMDVHLRYGCECASCTARSILVRYLTASGAS